MDGSYGHCHGLLIEVTIIHRHINGLLLFLLLNDHLWPWKLLLLLSGWWFGTFGLFSIYWECHHPN